MALLFKKIDLFNKHCKDFCHTYGIVIPLAALFFGVVFSVLSIVVTLSSIGSAADASKATSEALNAIEQQNVPRVSLSITTPVYDGNTFEIPAFVISNIGLVQVVDGRAFYESDLEGDFENEYSPYGGGVFYNNGGGMNQPVRRITSGNVKNVFLNKQRLAEKIAESGSKYLVFRFGDLRFQSKFHYSVIRVSLTRPLPDDWRDRVADPEFREEYGIVSPVVELLKYQDQYLQYQSVDFTPAGQEG